MQVLPYFVVGGGVLVAVVIGIVVGGWAWILVPVALVIGVAYALADQRMKRGERGGERLAADPRTD
jgi:hypothetical protein